MMSVAHFHHRFHRYFSQPAHLGGGNTSHPQRTRVGDDTYHPHPSERAAASVYIAPGSRSTVTVFISVSYSQNPEKMKFS